MRKYYLDNIRWVTVLLVVLYHVIMIFSGILPGLGMPFKDVQYQDGIMYVLYPWFMVLLFIVSGMSSRYYLEKHGIKDFIRSRTRKLLIPSTVGVIVIGWVQGYISMSISNAFETIPDTTPKPVLLFIMILSGQGILWFVQILWIHSMLLALVRRFEKGKLYELTGKANLFVIFLFGIPLWLSGLVLNMPVITVYRFGIYTFAFFFGYFVFAHDEVIERISKWKYIFIIGAVILAVFYLYLHFGENFAEMPLMGSVHAVAFAWITILGIFGSAYSWSNKTSKFADYMRTRSWGIYIFHYIALSGMALLLRRHTSLSEVPCYLITALAGFGGSLILYEIISRIPFLRWCTLGIKKEKKNVQGKSGATS